MRNSNRRRGGRSGPVASILAIVMVVAGCGSSATARPPTPAPTPVITADPHLRDPASLEDIFNALAAAGLRVTPNNAVAAAEPRRKINATFVDWPFVVSEFSSTAARKAATRWNPKVPVARDEAPYAFAGLNMLIEFGPTVTNNATAVAPALPYQEAAAALVRVLDPLIGPLEERAVVPIPVPAASPGPSRAQASPAPSASGH